MGTAEMEKIKMTKAKAVKKMTLALSIIIALALVLSLGTPPSRAESSTVAIGDAAITGDVGGYTYDESNRILSITSVGEYTIARASTSSYGSIPLSIVIEADGEVTLTLSNIIIRSTIISGKEVAEPAINIKSGSLTLVSVGASTIYSSGGLTNSETAPAIKGDVTITGDNLKIGGADGLSMSSSMSGERGGLGGYGIDGNLIVIDGSVDISAGSVGGSSSSLSSTPGGTYGVKGSITATNATVSVIGGAGGYITSKQNFVFAGDGGTGVLGDITATNSSITVTGGKGGGTSTSSAYVGRGGYAVMGDVILNNSTFTFNVGSDGAGGQSLTNGNYALVGDLTLNGGSIAEGKGGLGTAVVSGRLILNDGMVTLTSRGSRTIGYEFKIAEGANARFFGGDSAEEALRLNSYDEVPYFHAYTLSDKTVGDLVISAPVGKGYTILNNTLTISSGGEYEIALAEGITTSSTAIAVDTTEAVTLRLKDVKITPSAIGAAITGDGVIIEVFGTAVLGGNDASAISGDFTLTSGVIEAYGDGAPAFDGVMSVTSDAVLSIIAGDDAEGAGAVSTYQNEKYAKVGVTYTVTLYDNYSDGVITVDNISGEYMLPECTFTREGYHFSGWRLGQNGDIIKEESIVVSSNISLYVFWYPHLFSYNNDGICECGVYEPAEIINDPTSEYNGYYEIDNTGKLYWFSEYVNAGNPTASAVVTEYLLPGDNWTPIGSGGVVYTGTMVGVSSATISLNVSAKDGPYGLFGEFSGTLKNIEITGTIIVESPRTTDINDAIGGIAIMHGGVVSDVDFSICYLIYSEAGYVNTIGGAIGYMKGGTLDGVYYVGHTRMMAGTEANRIGGIVGYVDEGATATIKNIVYAGSFYLYDIEINCFGGFIGYANAPGLAIENCYIQLGVLKYVDVDTGNIRVVGDISDKARVSNLIYRADENYAATGTEIAGLVSVTEDERKSGHAAYLLGERFGQDLSKDEDEWDYLGYPTLGAPRVYLGYDTCDDDADMVYSNTALPTERPAHEWVWRADGARLVATCEKVGCDDSGCFELVIPTADGLIFDGREKPILVTGAARGVDTPEIERFGNMTQVGTHTARIVIDHVTAEVEVSITKREIKEDEITLSATEFLYTGEYIKPNITVVADGNTLALGDDYTIFVVGNLNAGTASMTITFFGNYSGSHTLNYEIKPRSTEGITVDPIPDVTYSPGYAGKPKIVLRDSDGTVLSGYNHSLRCENNEAVGTATVYITLSGNYTGSLVATYEVVPLLLKKEDIKVLEIGEFVANGEPHTPDPAIVFSYNTLVRDVDYTLSYLNNLGAGTATMVIDFIGNYDGEVRYDFEIAFDYAPVIGISLGAVLLLGGGGFALYWFVIRKRRLLG